ncbi:MULTISPECIES: XRE family transcriptional regulator [unclassified Ensifer]|uniref:helix-turn-helix domain-containing protein n=1 Tax=unclassified Ensifer TaxID=2633371 RepID=UPI000813C798|nr:MULTISPECIES: XRE family transcriptional regulator [unclassified Ensifer]OCP04890.1 Cro/Cl family transcriptional regulator [Ensifer sp. LC14]OCP08696.1 Cro/Cl family transcriptional regulator [Ensifer sp. LC11]OCP09954.1 Cro/Cl family transcriptional regulator [Ensifer sp. LC13]OCP33086.1 Cro/Cl family transcriptional regulator [Ensifer sp. LC499]
MAENKIFAGPRVRRIRNGLSLTQTAMAEALGISPSYLNLIERNQRPLTVQLLLKLASVYKVDLDELQGETGGSLTQLREVFADPLLSAELPGDQELVEVVEAAPNAAGGVVKLYRAYREQAARLKDLADLLAGQGHMAALSGTRLPMDEVRETFEARPNHFPGIETAAEAFHEALSPGDELLGALKAWLKKEHGLVVRSLPVHAMPNLRRRFDRHSMRLFISERLSPYDQLREIAMEAVSIACHEAIIAELGALRFSTAEARRIARFELARYGAHALMMPYAAFLAAAQRARYDIDVLRARFQVSFEQVANRLTMLQRPGAQGVPFFLMEIDNAGHRLRRAGASGFPQTKFGGGCPKLNIHAAFSVPGQVLVDRVEMPGGAEYLTVARTLDGPQAGFHERVRRTALLIGCEASFAGDIVYGSVLQPAIAIGAACRLCERQGCLARAEPPVTRPLGLDEMATGLSVFDFQ